MSEEGFGYHAAVELAAIHELQKEIADRLTRLNQGLALFLIHWAGYPDGIPEDGLIAIANVIAPEISMAQLPDNKGTADATPHESGHDSSTSHPSDRDVP